VLNLEDNYAGEKGISPVLNLARQIRYLELVYIRIVSKNHPVVSTQTRQAVPSERFCCYDVVVD